MSNLTDQERAELELIRAMKLRGMASETWRRYVSLKQKERGDEGSTDAG